MLELKTISRKAGEKVTPGNMAAVYYGAQAQSTPIFVNEIEFNKVFREAGESASITLLTEQGKKAAMIQEVQRHPVKHSPVHADFYILEKGQKVHVKLPLNFVGESAAVKGGAILVKVLHEISVEGDPSKLPHDISVDVSLLEGIDSNIHVRDLTLPAGVELYHVNADDIVASVSTQHEEKEPEAVDISAIEVEKKGKKEDEEAATE